MGLDYHQASVQVCVEDRAGEVLLNRRCRNDWVAAVKAAESCGLVARAAIESCGGAARARGSLPVVISNTRGKSALSEPMPHEMGCPMSPRGARQADAGLIKAGNRKLRATLMEAAHRLIRFDPRWSKLAIRLLAAGKPKCVVVAAIANRWVRWLFHVMQPARLSV